MNDRDKEISKEDSVEVNKNNGEVAAVQTVDEINSFSELAFSHRNGNK